MMKIFLFIFFLLFSNLHANHFFPKSVVVSKNGKIHNLELTGSVTRKKFFIKIYNVASYLEEGLKQSDLLHEIMKDGNAKQLTIHWLYSAPLEKVKKGYLASFKETLSSKEFFDLEEDIFNYLSFMRKSIRKGDEHIIRWLPGGHIESIINGNIEGTIISVPFAKALWNIWFSGGDAEGGSLLTLEK